MRSNLKREARKTQLRRLTEEIITSATKEQQDRVIGMLEGILSEIKKVDE